jgi:hypothetical protein
MTSKMVWHISRREFTNAAKHVWTLMNESGYTVDDTVEFLREFHGLLTERERNAVRDMFHCENDIA